ncbi:MBL fold metallo-hydrolase [Pseudohalioglobus lutimaris]|uniref:MBL fold metallo-hydrolase n=1 Tax=Pseudohalioglobus lutimaris TaxID=1737061 RepID=A0A2N5X3W3_9GAMM|nr:MBL fold metallo-hydrolase [Pseudohalioglobus lutimaris]
MQNRVEENQVQFRIVTVVENRVPQGLTPLLGEHGQAFFIDCGDRQLLFDTGQGLSLLHNADALGIDLCTINAVVLSHGHFDHAGGLLHLLQRTADFDLFAHHDAFERKMVNVRGTLFPVGVNDDRAALENAGVRLQLASGPQEIMPGVIATGSIPRRNEFEEIEPIFFCGQPGAECHDSLEDDQALVLDTHKGSVILMGCAHSGLINTLHHVAEITGCSKVHAILGGLHLEHAGQDRIERMLAHLREFEVDRMVVGHCTGMRPTAQLMNVLGDRVCANQVGYELVI